MQITADQYQSLLSKIQFLEERNDQLQEYIRLMQRSRFAAKNESMVHPGMRPLFSEDLLGSDDTQSQSADDEIEVPAHTRSRKRKPLPEDLPREEIFCDLPEEEKECPCCRKKMEPSQSKTSEKLHVKPAEYIVKKYITPVYSCKSCQEAKQAKMPFHPIPKCSGTPQTLAHIIVSKYIDGLPLYRLEKIFARSGIDISRDKMSRWVISVARHVGPIQSGLRKNLLSGRAMGMDETILQVLKEDGRRADQKSHMIVQTRDGPPGSRITLFHYEKSRAAVTLGKYLQGFEGSLVTDGLSSYNTCLGGIVHGGCWAHARRKFTEAVKGKKSRSKIAKECILHIRTLFKVEKDNSHLSGEKLLKVREKESLPVIESLEKIVTQNYDKFPKESLTGKAIRYLKNQWHQLKQFLTDPNLPLSNNYTERQIRPYVIGRKAWLFSDSVDGAHASAILYSILNTAKENGLNPFEYLTKVLSIAINENNAGEYLPLTG